MNMHTFLIKQKGIVPVIALAFALCIYAPLELFFLNRGEFWFDLVDMTKVILLSFVLALLLLLIPYVFINNEKRKIVTVIISTLTFCVYLQGNFIGIKVGVMNGADIAWRQYLPKMIFNLLIWLCAIIVGLISYAKKTKLFNIFIYVSGIVFGIQLITISVLLFQNITENNPNTRQTVAFTDKGLYTTDTEDNTLVFVLDMFDAEYFDSILANEPEWADILNGFILYDNYTGTYSTTSYSMAHLYTGEMFYNEIPQKEWVDSFADRRIYVDELLDFGYSVYYYSTIPGVIPDRFINIAGNYYDGECRVSNYMTLAYNMYGLVAFKYLPDGFKPLLWFDGDEFEALRECEDANVYMSDNARFRDGMKNSLWEETSEKTIRYIYTTGSHYPYRIDRNGRDVHIGEVNAVECARGVLKIVNDYLDHLREAGTYDNTSIIITADHGYYWDGTLQSPVMMIKPKGSTGRLQISNAPVCQADFGATILELSGIENYAEYGESILHITENSSRERMFYQYYLSEGSDEGNYRLIEYSVDSNGRRREDFELTGKEYKSDGELIDHYMYCETCKQGRAEEHDRDFPRLVHEKSSEYPR